MAYIPTEWSQGDKITSAKMNKLEQGVADAQGGGDGVFTAIYGTTTFSAVQSAVNNGKFVVATYGNDVYALAAKSSTRYTFFNGNISQNQPALWTIYVDSATGWDNAGYSLQPKLTSGTTIKTVNNQSLLGAGNITISGGGAVNSVNGKTGTVVLGAEDVAETVTMVSGTSIQLQPWDTRVLYNAPASLAVTFSAPDIDLESTVFPNILYGLTFKVGNYFQGYTHTAPTGCVIQWANGDEPTWTAGKAYEIIYRVLCTTDYSGNIIISAKFAEVTL